jgi:hypothetical protein
MKPDKKLLVNAMRESVNELKRDHFANQRILAILESLIFIHEMEVDREQAEQK